MRLSKALKETEIVIKRVLRTEPVVE